MISIKRIQNSEILSFINDSGLLEWKHLPISKRRAISYSQNPRSEPSDIVLYMAFINNELVGYRTIMPDTIFVNDLQVKVGWLSGNWVLESYRRQGIASLLLNEALIDWNHHLFYTNYALESKAVYDKSGHFDALLSKSGRRFYIRSCFSTILPPKSGLFAKLKGALQFIDALLNLFNLFLIFGRVKQLERGVEVEYLSQPDNDIAKMFQYLGDNTATKRTIKELDWILKYPWLDSSSEDLSDSDKYFFSSNRKRFVQQIIKLKRGGAAIGFMLITLNNEKLSVPYCYYNPSDTSLFVSVMVSYAFKNGASTITVYDNKLAETIALKPIFRLFSKGQIQNYYATKEIVNVLKENPVFFNSGDGDCAFV